MEALSNVSLSMKGADSDREEGVRGGGGGRRRQEGVVECQLMG